MTTRKEALIALRDKVRDEYSPDDSNEEPLLSAFVSEDHRHLVYRIIGVDMHPMDAALALCEAVLPEWSPDFCRIFLENKWNASLCHVVRVIGDDLIEGDNYDDIDCTVEAISDTPARALLLAILEAKIAEEE